MERSEVIEKLLDHILRVEGGYVDHPDDPGGETKYGISKRSYPNVDIKNLTEQDARRIYTRDFIAPFIDRIKDPRLLTLVVDAAVNHGISRAEKWLVQCPTFDLFMAKRIEFYVSLQTFDKFGRGWMNRLVHAYKAAEQFAGIAKLIDNRPFNVRLKAFIDKENSVVRYRVRSTADGKELKLDIS